MPELISLDRVLQVGVESTAGVVVPATKQFQTVKYVPAITPTTTEFMPQGQKLNSLVVYNKEETGGPLTWQPSYGEIVYLLSGLLGAATISTPVGGSRSRLWTWNWYGNVGDVQKTFSVETGDSVGAETFGYGLVSGLTASFARDKISGGGTMLGQRTNAAGSMTALTAVNAIQSVVATGATSGTFTLGFGTTVVTTAIQWNSTIALLQPILNAAFGAGNVTAAGGPLPATPITLTFSGPYAGQPLPALTPNNTSLVGGTAAVTQPTPGVAITPEPGGVQVISPAQIDLYVDPTPGAFGTTKMLRSWQFDWGITGKNQTAYPLNSASTSFAAAPEKASTAEVKLTMSSDTQGVDFITATRASGTRYVRLLCTGPIIEGAIPFSATIDVALKVKALGPAKDFSGMYVREFTCDIVQDSAWGQAMKVTICNAVLGL